MHPSPYLFFAGNCFEAMSLYADVLGGEIVSVTRNSDAASPEDRMPGPDDAVMNMGVRTEGGMIFGSDAPAEWHKTPQGFRLQIETGSRAEFDRLEAALGKNAQSVDMPADETFWAERFAMFTDRFGTPWMLNFTGAKAA